LAEADGLDQLANDRFERVALDPAAACAQGHDLGWERLRRCIDRALQLVGAQPDRRRDAIDIDDAEVSVIELMHGGVRHALDAESGACVAITVLIGVERSLQLVGRHVQRQHLFDLFGVGTCVQLEVADLVELRQLTVYLVTVHA
jgi:hypothetical protein